MFNHTYLFIKFVFMLASNAPFLVRDPVQCFLPPCKVGEAGNSFLFVNDKK